jgi:hypothetical protein
MRHPSRLVCETQFHLYIASQKLEASSQRLDFK